MIQAIHSYLKNIQEKYITGISSEHSFRSDLETLLIACCPTIDPPMNEPKGDGRIKPDFAITKNRLPIGFIECKDIKTGILDSKDTIEQIKKYFNHNLGGNFILTDYIEFRFYQNNDIIQTVKLSNITAPHNLLDNPTNIIPLKNDKTIWLINQTECQKLAIAMASFAGYQWQSIGKSDMLSKMMADTTRNIKEVIYDTLINKQGGKETDLHAQFAGFKKELIHDMTEEQFADVYAQTIAYGLFTARLHNDTPESFSIEEAYRCLPISNPFLKKLFRLLSDNADLNIAWAINHLVTMFKSCDIKNILADYKKTTHSHDPIIYFYEDFLKDYDSIVRDQRGVWYTPEPVVDFIVRGIDDLLKTEFQIPDGLADYSKIEIETDVHNKGKITKQKQKVHRVQVLDPATGTGTFLAHIIKHIHKQPQFQGGLWNSYVSDHLIPRLHGFEILMASYAIAHLKLDLLLTETGYRPQNIQRLSIYLTNALEEPHSEAGSLFAAMLANEANEAANIKKNKPIMVVLGNPPYRGESQNKGAWIKKQLDVYKKEPNSTNRLKERNTKWLNDDYVKFIRLAEHYIDKNEQGIIGFITNHAYLDNTTFRGMRYHLMNTFDDLYIINLHGSVEKKEKHPNESKNNDDNVFNIKQGVSIILAVKKKQETIKETLAHIYHYDLRGKRQNKEEFLLNHNLQTVKWQMLTPIEPHYFFVPKNFDFGKRYKKGFSVNELFTVNSVGIVTSRDNFIIDDNENTLTNRLKEFCNAAQDSNSLKNKFNLKENSSWKIEKTKCHIFNAENIIPINYRPFDARYIYFHKDMIERSRFRVMQHFLKNENWGLMTTKKVEKGSFKHSIIHNTIIESHSVSLKESNYTFPLYIYNKPHTSNAPEFTLEKTTNKTKRKPNFNLDLIQKFAKAIKLKFVPDHADDTQSLSKNKTTLNPLDMLDYIYAVLHSPSYRETYKEFLKIDFPRIPYPNDTQIFWQFVTLGRQIRDIHLLENPLVSQNLPSYPIEGNHRVDKPRFANGKVFINNTQYFDDISATAWNFYIGGYQPAQKWLEDREGKELSFDDIQHYKKIIRALTETHRLMQEIDAIELL